MCIRPPSSLCKKTLSGVSRDYQICFKDCAEMLYFLLSCIVLKSILTDFPVILCHHQVALLSLPLNFGPTDCFCFHFKGCDRVVMPPAHLLCHVKL